MRLKECNHGVQMECLYTNSMRNGVYSSTHFNDAFCRFVYFDTAENSKTKDYVNLYVRLDEDTGLRTNRETEATLCCFVPDKPFAQSWSRVCKP